MKLLNNYDNYIIDIVLEKFRFDEMILVMSDELTSILDDMEHPIAKKILFVNNIKIFKSKITLLDIDKSDENKLDNISFTTSTKTIENLVKDFGLKLDDEYSINSSQNSHIFDFLNAYKETYLNNKNRSVTSLGKIVNKLFPNEFSASGKPGEDIESFINEYKAIIVSNKTFEIVYGDDIKYWYNEKQYRFGAGSLNKSCMRYNDCDDYLSFYSKNKDKVSLLILKDIKNEKLIRGRALIWKLNEPNNRIFMDRIYTVYDSDIKLFIDYAKANNWLYKNEQNYTNNEIVDPITNNISNIKLSVSDFKSTNYYPFLDTLSYYDNKTLSNNSIGLNIEKLKLLRDTEGYYISIITYSNFYHEWIDISDDSDYKECNWINEYRYIDDCFFSNYYYCWVAYDYAVENGVICDYPKDKNEWRKIGNYVELSNGETSTKEYAYDKFTYDKSQDLWFFDGVYSYKYKKYIEKEDAVEVFIDKEEDSIDWRIKNDGTYYKYKKELFDNSLKNNLK